MLAESRLAIGINAHTVWGCMVSMCTSGVHVLLLPHSAQMLQLTGCQHVFCFLNLKFSLPNGGG